MTYIIHAPQKAQGTVRLPASKSISNRVLILRELSGGHSLVENLSDCDDTRMVIKALTEGGNKFDIGAAGTAMRFLTAFLANKTGEWEITGSERMKQRPIRVLVDALKTLGADIEYLGNEGFPPLRIAGKPLSGSEIDLEGSISSQYVSAILMIAPTLANGLIINLKGNVISKPYILLTLKIMEKFGVSHMWDKGRIVIAHQAYKPVPFKVESDWSAASYWYEILSLCGSGEIFLPGLEVRSMQGDAKVSELFSRLGVETSYAADGVTLRCTNCVADSMIYNFVEQPDLVQTFVVTCCLLNVPFSFTGLQSLKIKETNRVAALTDEMRKLGFVLCEPENGALAWSGERVPATAEISVKTYEDHRMAMAFAPAALKMKNIKIENPNVVTKSYPTFWDDLKSVGFSIVEQ